MPHVTTTDLTTPTGPVPIPTVGFGVWQVPDDQVEAETAALVERLAGAATVALGLTKRCITRSLQMNLSDSMEAEAFALELSSRTGDFKEGLVAFGERRPAKFTGR